MLRKKGYKVCWKESSWLFAKGVPQYRYKVDKNINPGYTHWVYFKTKSDALKFVKSHPAYPTVIQHVYPVVKDEKIPAEDMR